MAKFKSKGRLDIWVPENGVSVTIDGEYETTDKNEIAALKDYPGVTSVSEGKPKTSTKKAPAARNKKAPASKNK
jgi:hypothetical protein